MRLLFIIIFIVSACVAHAQTILQGVVIDIETGKPLAGIAVFVSNTSNGTVTSPDGSYQLQIPNGKYEVIFSAVNYTTKVIATGSADSFRLVRLVPKVKVLEDVTVHVHDANGWHNWGQFFLNNFIGTNQFSSGCKLMNPETLRFYYNKKTGELTVEAFDVLVIENHSLGYFLKYQLEQFVYDSKTKIVYYEGYPLFEEMKGNERKMRRWKKQRREAYEGSQLHFMRAVYRNEIAEEGFELHRLKKIKNSEKQRIRSIIRRRGFDADSSDYYDRVLSQPDEFDVMNAEKLTGDSIAFAVDSITAGMGFPDYLDILYKKKPTHEKYREQFPKNPHQRISQITLLNISYVEIQQDGSFFPTRNMLSLGYWSWSEKMSAMLPFDYKPLP